ncbi:alanine/glycine:cation symporter family protein [Streptomonospora nanhaiensis]|uniref:AGCS family alanine or glycine:cation symporter n=1 Tax=Streptomonospora nanhaiensis TaxID=1323731 RepID=A0A853BLI3_9ACTN|nr:sodium:alanine symporter family protein [Streptomonospora nanhaiensis]MBV2363196.1 sodium:alanine symporter family protein [Streptomonospora nanhaiensis]MBX9390089.1 sodium:alanine symporter family protein [Streptomonospora nanhaiensis]NYI95554.1 AGCS family alanine or glycine:cation symporter [Streptomonospora nanhaiensis]
MAQLQEILGEISSVVWGPFVLIPLLLLTGLYLTIRLRLLQFRVLFHALWLALFRRTEGGDAQGDISHYQALSTALAATVGVGNIAGAALAITAGGPGALFWMWVVAALGMATKYSEALLGVKYRRPDARGEQSGGPMFYLRYGLPGGLGLVLGGAFAVFGAIASFGIGNGTQANTVALQMEDVFSIPPWISGIVLVVVTALVVIGGIKSIGRFASAVVPLMIVFYIVISLLVLIAHIGDLPAAIALVFTEAFTGRSATGGLLGSALLFAIQQGVARGIFSNESGLGTGGIAAASAKTDQPVRQAMVSMTQTFIDTIIVVSMTCLVIIVTGAWETSTDDGSLLTAQAMSDGLGAISPALAPLGTYGVAISVMFFAFTTIVGWSYYGERCIDFLVGRKGVFPFRLVFVAVVYIGATVPLDVIWSFSDIANGLMALPNLVGLLLLSGVVVAETKKYFANPDWKNPDSTIVDVRS